MKEDKDAGLTYSRVSSETQSRDGHGLEGQEKRGRDTFRDRGLPYECAFRDSYSGGGDFRRRPGLMEMFEYIDSNPHKRYSVYIDDLTRLARDTMGHIEIRAELEKRDVELVCPNYDFDETPEGKFIETIFAARGQYDRESNKRRVIQRQKARLENGFWAFNPPPGLKHQKIQGSNILVPDEPDASLIREAVNGFCTDRFPTQTDVQNFLRENNFRNGRPVYLETVKRLLRRSIYAGMIEYPEWGVERRRGYHEALISINTFAIDKNFCETSLLV